MSLDALQARLDGLTVAQRRLDELLEAAEQRMRSPGARDHGHRHRLQERERIDEAAEALVKAARDLARCDDSIHCGHVPRTAAGDPRAAQRL